MQRMEAMAASQERMMQYIMGPSRLPRAASALMLEDRVPMLQLADSTLPVAAPQLPPPPAVHSAPSTLAILPATSPVIDAADPSPEKPIPVAAEIDDMLDMLAARRAGAAAQRLSGKSPPEKVAGNNEPVVTSNSPPVKVAAKAGPKSASYSSPTKAAAKAGPKSTNNASPAKVPAKAGPTLSRKSSGKAPAKAGVAAKFVLGCSKCRWLPKGCAQCRDTSFGGCRWKTIEPKH